MSQYMTVAEWSLAGDTPCQGVTGSNGVCYVYMQDNRTWDQAQSTCVAMGAGIASIEVGWVFWK